LIYDPELEARLAALEPPYKSKGEAQVGRVLNRYGIPFVYEQPTLIYDRGRHRVWHPDFTLPSYGSLIIEYAGMPDVPEYMQGIRHKEKVYKANQMPALFLYPADLQGPAWPQRIMDHLNDYAVPSQQPGMGADMDGRATLVPHAYRWQA